MHQILSEIDKIRNDLDNYKPIGRKGVTTNLEKEKLIHANTYKVRILADSKYICNE